MSSLYTPETVAAVCGHMNADHVEDSLLIARSLGGRPTATEASVTGLGPEGATFEVVVDGATESVVVTWEHQPVERADLRAEVVRMYHEACAALGVPARAAAEH